MCADFPVVLVPSAIDRSGDREPESRIRIYWLILMSWADTAQSSFCLPAAVFSAVLSASE